MKRIFCVGRDAFVHRVKVDLDYPSHRLICLVQDDSDDYRMMGLRGPDFWWIDYGATPRMRERCRIQGFRQVTVEEARLAIQLDRLNTGH